VEIATNWEAIEIRRNWNAKITLVTKLHNLSDVLLVVTKSSRPEIARLASYTSPRREERSTDR